MNFNVLFWFVKVTFPTAVEESLLPASEQSCRFVDYHIMCLPLYHHATDVSRATESNNVGLVPRVCSCSTGPPLASGPWFLERPTCQRRAHREGQHSHYSYNEIIMNAAPRPHHRNIYCIIYSASPLVQGERTHINFQARSSPPHSSSCLLLKAEVHARSLSFFHSFFFLSFSLLFFLPR